MNCFKQLKLLTLSDLVSTTADQLLAVHNFSEGCLSLVRRVLAQEGLHLRADKILAPSEELLDMPLKNFTGRGGFNRRSMACFQHLELSTLRDLVAKTADELLETSNFGADSLKSVREVLARQGLHLRLG